MRNWWFSLDSNLTQLQDEQTFHDGNNLVLKPSKREKSDKTPRKNFAISFDNFAFADFKYKIIRKNHLSTQMIIHFCQFNFIF